MSDVMKIIEKFEDQHEVSLEIRNPYLMSKGWSKVDYTSTKKTNKNPDYTGFLLKLKNNRQRKRY